MCLDVVLLGLILFGTLCASWTWMSVSFPRLGKFSVIMSSNNVLCPFLSSPSETFIIQMLVYFMLSLSSLKLSSFKKIIFFFLFGLSDFHSLLQFADLFLFSKNLFIYFWLCWVFVSVRGLSPVAASGDHSSSRCTGLSLSRPLVVEHGSRRAGSVVAAHGPSCSAACGILPDQGSNPCPLHWQADSQPLRHQGSPDLFLCII